MIDAIIALIRGAADVDVARAGLMAKPFEFSEIQANYILDMQLRRLTQLEGTKLRDELDELQATIKELESILKSKTKLNKVIKDELARAARASTPTSGARSSPSTPARSTSSTSSTTKRSSSSSRTRATSRRSRPTRSAARVAAAGRAGQPRPRRRLRRQPAHDDRALVPAALLEPRQGVPAARARDPDEGPHRARHRAREPHHARERGADPGDHRHAHLRGRRVPVLRDEAAAR